jgi:hypothetical protein
MASCSSALTKIDCVGSRRKFFQMRTGKNVDMTRCQFIDEKVVVVAKILGSMRRCDGLATTGLGVLSFALVPSSIHSFSTTFREFLH